MLLDWELENRRSSSAPLSSDLLVERIRWELSELVDERLLCSILGFSSSLTREVIHSTTEAGEADFFVDRLLSTAELGEGDLLAFFFDFSPRGSIGLRDLSLRSEGEARGLCVLSLRPEASARGLCVLSLRPEASARGLGGSAGRGVARLLEGRVGANDLLGSASRASPNMVMSGD